MKIRGHEQVSYLPEFYFNTLEFCMLPYALVLKFYNCFGFGNENVGNKINSMMYFQVYCITKNLNNYIQVNTSDLYASSFIYSINQIHPLF